MEDQNQSKQSRPGIGDGIRQGLGILNSFRQAVEDSLQEAVQRGDLSADRATQTMKDILQRAQTGFDDARGRLDFVQRAEHENLKREVEALRLRVDALESGGPTA